MRIHSLFSVVLFAALLGCSKVPAEKTVTLLNAAAVDAPLLERLRAFAEKELHVPVRAVEKPSLAGQVSFDGLETAALNERTEADAVLIVLANVSGSNQHLKVNAEEIYAAVNGSPLQMDDAETFARRLERQVMRGAAFAVGLAPTPDPFCVTRDYRSLEDLDSMGRNFSPPWQGRFAEKAAALGLERPAEPAPAFPGK